MNYTLHPALTGTYELEFNHHVANAGYLLDGEGSIQRQGGCVKLSVVPRDQCRAGRL
jgi:hypothetical protein